jgi:hypothetical protein
MSTQDFQASEASQLPALPWPKPRSQVNLTWPSSIAYTPTCILDSTSENITQKLVQELDDLGSSGGPTGERNSVDRIAYIPDLSAMEVDEAIISGGSSIGSPLYSETPQCSASPLPMAYRRVTAFPALVDARDIRLFQLSEGSLDEPIHGSLELASLTQFPQFEALSYTWADKDGDYTRCRKLFLGPAWDVLPITANCDAALRRLRYSDGPRFLWVDSICINQDDNRERSHQVRNMREIYAAASHVMIYLGGAYDESHIAMLEISGPHDSGAAAIGNDKYVVSAIRNLFGRPYFSRIWVIQEVAMARLATVYCGVESLGWSKFHPSTLKKIDGMEVAPSWIEHFDRPRHIGMEDFPQLLIDTYECKSSDPRDKVFALLGLILTANQDGLLADYSLTVEQLYIGLAAHLITNYPSCKILRYRNSNPLLPSWVPDWHESPSTPNLLNIFHTGWPANRERGYAGYFADLPSCQTHYGSDWDRYPEEVYLHLRS